ncbi:MAG: hypothetical protein KDD37_01060 [Bdellovibrionales bacterium]|nr:hypothetical protein [Bdellovibrionales bacterium]
MSTHRYSFGYLLLTLVLISCATGSKLGDLDYPINYIHDAIKQNLPAPISSVSENGRNYSTKAYAVPLYYRRKAQVKKGPPAERAYARVSINEITRPYTLNIKIDIEELVSGPREKPRYVICCRNPEMENELAQKIKDYLVKRYKKTNVIDDFRAF